MHDVAFTPLRTKILGLIMLMRPKQWIKNGFVLAPLIFTGEFLNLEAVSHALLATLLFCLTASTTYLINDLYDLEHDRCHPRKSKTRPLAAGIVSISAAQMMLSVLLVVLVGGWFIAPTVMRVLCIYLLLNLAYTWRLKEVPVVDIFIIAVGFVLRVSAGAVAIAVSVSSWIFITTLCLALYLAATKRRQELKQCGAASRKVLAQYSVHLVDRYAEISATGALLFYSMFVLSTKPQLVMTIPLVLFGLFRYWYLVETLEGDESPTEELLSDWSLLCTVILWVAVCGWVLWPIQG